MSNFDIIVRPETKLGEDWMILAFIFIVLLLLISGRNHMDYLRSFFSSIMRGRAISSATRAETAIPKQSGFTLVVYFMVAGLCLYLVQKYLNVQLLQLNGPILFAACTAFFALVYFARIVVGKAIQLFADGDYGINEYQHSTILVNGMAGILLFPVAILFSYLRPADLLPILAASAVFVVLMWCLRLIRGINMGIKHNVKAFYIFFYICTFEILPLLLLYKLVLNMGCI